MCGRKPHQFTSHIKCQILLNLFYFVFFLVQVHTAHELDRVLGIEEIGLIGINNRDLGIFIYIDLHYLTCEFFLIKYFHCMGHLYCCSKINHSQRKDSHRL